MERDQVKAIVRQHRAVEDVLEERRRQDEQWGVQNHHPAYWLAIMGKQVGQFGSEVLNREWWSNQEAATVRLRNEAVQMAAVALAIVESIDRGDMPVGLTTAKPDNPRQLARALGHGDEQIRYDDDDPICACRMPGETHRVSLHDDPADVDFGEPGSEPCS